MYSTLLRCLRLSYVIARCLVLPAVRLSVCLGHASVKELRGVFCRWIHMFDLRYEC
jgi:hypothetical protein